MVGILKAKAPTNVEAISKEELFKRLDDRKAKADAEFARITAENEKMKADRKAAKEKKKAEKKTFAQVKDETSNKAKDAIHNMKLHKYGLSVSDDFSADINDEGKISHCLKKRNISMPPEIKDDLDDYFVQIIKNDFKENTDFSEKDGEIYNIAKTLFNAPYGTPDGEKGLMDISRFMNIRARQIGDKAWKDEKVNAKAIRKSWENNEVIKSGIGKFAKEENWLKNAAWIATHAFCLDQFLSEEAISYLIPITDKQEIVDAWNSYLEGFTDLPVSVKTYFNLEKNGKCHFLDAYKITSKIKQESPKDDQVFDSSADVDGQNITLNPPTVEERAAELDMQFAEAVYNDNVKDQRKSESKVINVPVIEATSSGEFTFGQLHEKEKENVINPATIAQQMCNTQQNASKAAVRINPATGMPEAVSFDEYFYNNSEWESCVNKLNEFTKIVHDNGMSVMYEPDRMYPGIILATIFQKGATPIYNQVRIDPYIIYGDALRIITMENRDNDLRKETFIPVTQTTMVTKLLKKEFTKEDRQKVNETLPRVFSDFSEKYHILDRIDFRGISNGKGITAKDYKKTVENISNILKDRDIPVCRFRIADYVDPNNFKLICDQNVLLSFPTGIVNEPSNVDALMKSIVIDYNPATANNKKSFRIGSLVA